MKGGKGCERGRRCHGKRERGNRAWGGAGEGPGALRGVRGRGGCGSEPCGRAPRPGGAIPSRRGSICEGSAPALRLSTRGEGSPVHHPPVEKERRRLSSSPVAEQHTSLASLRKGSVTKIGPASHLFLGMLGDLLEQNGSPRRELDCLIASTGGLSANQRLGRCRAPRVACCRSNLRYHGIDCAQRQGSCGVVWDVRLLSNCNETVMTSMYSVTAARGWLLNGIHAPPAAGSIVCRLPANVLRRQLTAAAPVSDLL